MSPNGVFIRPDFYPQISLDIYYHINLKFNVEMQWEQQTNYLSYKVTSRMVLMLILAQKFWGANLFEQSVQIRN